MIPPMLLAVPRIMGLVVSRWLSAPSRKPTRTPASRTATNRQLPTRNTTLQRGREISQSQIFSNSTQNLYTEFAMALRLRYPENKHARKSKRRDTYPSSLHRPSGGVRCERWRKRRRPAPFPQIQRATILRIKGHAPAQ